MFTRVFVCGAIAGAVLTATPAFSAGAASKRDHDDCMQREDHDRRIRGCTEIINARFEDRLDHIVSYTRRGMAWYDKKDYDRAIADFSQAMAIRLDPKENVAYHNLGNTWRATAYNQRCLAYRDKQDYDRAIDDCSKAIRLDPKYAVAYSGRCGAYYFKKDYDRAIEDCSEAIRLEPKAIFAYFYRAKAHLDRGNRERAIDDFRKAHDRGHSQAGEELRKLAASPAAVTSVPAMPASPTPAATAGCSRADLHWKSAEEIKSLAVYEDHLARFPDCEFAVLARARIEALRRQDAK